MIRRLALSRMRLWPAGTVLLAAWAIIGAPSFAEGAPETAPRRQNPPKRRIPRISNRAARQYELYTKGPDEIRALETEEMVEIAKQMYGLNDREIPSVRAEIERIQHKRWMADEDAAEYVRLLSERERLCRDASAGSEPGESVRAKLSRLRRNREFAKTLSDLRKYERDHKHAFVDFTEPIEALIAPRKVKEAHRLWQRRSRSRELQTGLRLKGLMRGLSTKRPTNRDGDKKATGTPKIDRGAPRPAKGKKSGGPAPAGKGARPPSRKKPSRPGGARPPGPSKPVGQWENVVVAFIDRHGLSPTQTNAAWSILKDVSSRAAQIQRAGESMKADAQRIADAKQRKARLARLQYPIDALFQELQQRLDGLLTAEQRSRFGSGGRK